MRNSTGNIFTNLSYSNFSRKVECQYVYVDQQAGEKDPIFILTTVNVYYSGRKIADTKMLIGEYDDDDDDSSKIDFL